MDTPARVLPTPVVTKPHPGAQLAIYANARPRFAGHRKSDPKQRGPFSASKTVPQSVKAHSGPSLFGARFGGPKRTPILGPLQRHRGLKTAASNERVARNPKIIAPCASYQAATPSTKGMARAAQLLNGFGHKCKLRYCCLPKTRPALTRNPKPFASAPSPS